MRRPSVAVIRFPGSNCEDESVRVLRRVGLEACILRWNEDPREVRRHQAYLLPGGFSYQDRVRAGAVAARLPVLDYLVERASAGAPVLGLCNGAQILIEAGLVPDGGERITAALAPNRSVGRRGYYTRWIFLTPGPAAERCLFTRALRDALPIPMAHAEGRFAAFGSEAERQLHSAGALCYADPTGTPAHTFPANPNGSWRALAGITNEAGNVLALMPHPERAQTLAQVPEATPGPWGDRRRAARRAADLESDGPGLHIFRALARHLQEGT